MLRVVSSVILAFVAAAVLNGCARGIPAGPFPNPTVVPAGDPDFIWDEIVDVVDNYFEIDREQRVQRIGDVLTRGRIDTLPVVGATVFEPTRFDSANFTERVESTFQTIRRQAIIRVDPSPTGYEIEVAVYKELEDLERPEHATTGAATLRYDNSINRFTEPVGGRGTNVGWIDRGRDFALEQRIIAVLQYRLGSVPGAHVRAFAPPDSAGAVSPGVEILPPTTPIPSNTAPPADPRMAPPIHRLPPDR